MLDSVLICDQVRGPDLCCRVPLPLASEAAEGLQLRSINRINIVIRYLDASLGHTCAAGFQSCAARTRVIE